MPFVRLGRAALVAALACLPLLAVVNYVSGDARQLLVGVVITVPLYLWLARRTGVVAAGDLTYVGRLLTLRTLWERRAAR